MRRIVNGPEEASEPALAYRQSRETIQRAHGESFNP
jgi:hypothetical protein